MIFDITERKNQTVQAKPATSTQSAKSINGRAEVVVNPFAKLFGNYKNADKPIKTVANVYMSILEECESLGISLEDAKKYKLLETITGLSTAELTTLSNKEIKEIKEALASVSSFTSHPVRKIASFLGVSQNDAAKIKQMATEARQKKIDNSYNIGWWSRTWDNLFGKDFENSQELDKYIQDILGDDFAQLSPAAKKERYAKAEKCLMLKANSKRNKGFKANNIYASGLKNVRANRRSAMARDIILYSCDEPEMQSRAFAFQNNFKDNMITPDRYGSTVSKQDATDYTRTTFRYMNEEGVTKSAEALKQLANETEPEYRELNNKLNNGETLSAKEMARLSELKLLHDSVNVPGHAGALLGLSLNTFVPTECADNTAMGLYKNAQTQQMANEVLGTMVDYMNAHPELTEALGPEYMDRLNLITEDGYSKVLAGGSVEVYTVESSQSDYRPAEQTSSVNQSVSKQNSQQDKTEITVKAELNTNQPKAVTSSHLTNKNESSVNKVDESQTAEIVKPDSKTGDSAGVKNSVKQTSKSAEDAKKELNQNIALGNVDKLVQENGIKETIKAIRENHTLKESIKIIIENSKNNAIIDVALGWFENNLSEDDKETVFTNVALIGKKLLAPHLSEKQLTEYMKNTDEVTKKALQPTLKMKQITNPLRQRNNNLQSVG